jgi:flavin reductase (DIM6/NTAB) family NADH-FMN oxidoreductase RutF
MPDPRPAPSPADFRAVMSRFGTGVTVMTCHHAGEPHGMTANAVSSVSLDPLLALVCVGHDTEMCRLVRESGAFALSILPGGAQALSNHFADASRPSGSAQFESVHTRTAATGAPVLEGALGWLDCRVWKIHDGGDHDIVVGEVVACDVGTGDAALGYYRSGYTTITPP